MLAQQTVPSNKVSGLVVHGVDEEAEIALPKVYTREAIPTSCSQIPRPETTSNLMPYRSDVEVGLLIGLNCTRAIKPLKVIPGENDKPYAVKTVLGWGVIGIVSPNVYSEDGEHDMGVHRINVCEVNQNDQSCHSALQTHTKEVIRPLQINKIFELDVNGRKTAEQPRQLDDGHYELPVPFKEDEPKLPNSKKAVMNRLGKPT